MVYKSRFRQILKKMNERRMSEYKAWYSPKTDTLYQFNTNLLHSEIAEEKLGLENEIEAMKAGYYRIFCGHELDVDSYKRPDEREFKAVQYAIEQNSYKKFDSTRWSVYTEKGFWFFPKLSFLFADKIEDGKLKTFR